MTKADLWSYDAEVAPNFFSITFKKIGTDIVKVFYMHEYSILGISFIELRDFVLTPNRWFIGFNNLFFDDILLDQLIRYDPNRFVVDLVIRDLYETASMLIAKVKEDYDEYRRLIYGIKKKKFNTLDIKKISRLYKSLKSTAVNIKYPFIQDMPVKVGEEIIKEEIPIVLAYNLNDVEMVEDMFLKGEVSYGTTIREEINLRIKVGKKYKIDILNEDRSGMANRLLEAYYSQYTGVSPRVFKDFRTSYPQGLDIKYTIPKDVNFKTKVLQSLLEEMKFSHVKDASDRFKFRIRINNTAYDIGKGGLHSVRKNVIFNETDDIELVDCDAASFYPRIMLKNRIKPKHLEPVFLKIVETIYNQRITAKSNDNKVVAEALKITINSIFGKLGEDKYWLYDLMAMYQVTISGQLYLLMLIERLEIAGFEVVYANTDGITTRVPKNRRDEYDKICLRWQQYTTFTLEFTNYKKAVIRDVNNYLIIYDDPKKGSQVKMKGFFDTESWKDVVKSFSMPVVAYAVRAYFEFNTPVEETINNCTDPLDFCLSQVSGEAFKIEMDQAIGGKVVTQKLQKTNRYLISATAANSGAIYKVKGGVRASVPPTAGQIVRIMNDVRKPIPDLRINRGWYIKKALEEIEPFRMAEQQLSLF